MSAHTPSGSAKERPTVTRRRALGVIGGSVIGVGGLALSPNPVSARSNVEISANDVSLVSLEGEVASVFVLPNLTLRWSNFRESVSGFQFLIEARLLDHPRAEWLPVFRRFLPLENVSDQSSATDGTVDINPNRFAVYGTPPVEIPRFAVLVASRVGIPEYLDEAYVEGTDFSTLPDHDPEQLINHSDFDFGNPEPLAFDRRFGYYGAAMDVADFETADVGETVVAAAIELRYTTAFLVGDQFSDIAMFDAVEVGDLQDHDANNVPHSVLAESGDHPAIAVSEADFSVVVENPEAEAEASGESGTGGIAS